MTPSTMIKWLIPFLLLSQMASAQNPLADSLRMALDGHPQEDTVRVQILNQLAFEKHFNYPGEAIDYALKARDLAERLHDQTGRALSYRYAGLAFWTQGSNEFAMRAFVKGLEIADSAHLVQIEADLNGNIGLVYNSMSDYKTALGYFQNSYKKQQELHNLKRQIVMLNSLGDCYRALGQPDEALVQYKSSRKLGEPIDYLVETNLRNIGNVYEKMGNYDSALSVYRRSMALSDRFNEKKEQSLIRQCLARVHLSKGELKEAKSLCLTSVEIARAGNLRSIIRDDYELLSRIAQAQDNPGQALMYTQQFIVYADSVKTLSNQLSINAIRTEYEVQKKEAEIAALEALARQRDTEISLRNGLLWLAIIAVALLAALLTVTIYNQKYHRKLNLLLKEKNRTIDQFNQALREANEGLETKVKQRTAVLEEQNKALTEYSFFNAHKLRAPVASMMGLVTLVTSGHVSEEERAQVFAHLRTCCDELDFTIREINSRINESLSSYQEHNDAGHGVDNSEAPLAM